MYNIFITGGVHGDEPSGALALDPLRKRGFSVFGPCNPWGLAHNKRALENGRDLNRMFARRNCPQAQAVREAVAGAHPQILIDLHEDKRAARPYVIQFGKGDIGLRLVAALKHRYQFEPRPGYFPLRGSNGVLRPSRAVLWLVGLSRRWPLAYWFWRRFGRTGVVVEAPGAYTLEERVAFHTAVAEVAATLSA
jgi:predicted deacylase